MSDEGGDRADDPSPEDPFPDDAETTDIGDVFDELRELEDLVQSPAAREQVRETMRVAIAAGKSPNPFRRVIKGYDWGDLAESLLGSLLFGIPMAVEGGTQEVAAFLAVHPVSLVGTFLFAIGLVIGILYVADFRDVRIHQPIFGVIPRRLVGVVSVSFLTAVILLTAWGRVAWADPVLAVANAVVAFVPMSIGAALGDLLPGS